MARGFGDGALNSATGRLAQSLGLRLSKEQLSNSSSRRPRWPAVLDPAWCHAGPTMLARVDLPSTQRTADHRCGLSRGAGEATMPQMAAQAQAGGAGAGLTGTSSISIVPPQMRSTPGVASAAAITACVYAGRVLP